MTHRQCPRCGGWTETAPSRYPNCSWAPVNGPTAPSQPPLTGTRAWRFVAPSAVIVALLVGVLVTGFAGPDPSRQLASLRAALGIGSALQASAGGGTPPQGGGAAGDTRWLSVAVPAGFQISSQSDADIVIVPQAGYGFVEVHQEDVQGQAGMDPTQLILDQIRQSSPDAHLCGDAQQTTLNHGAVPALTLRVCLTVRSQDKAEPWVEEVRAAVVDGSASLPSLIEIIVGAPAADIGILDSQVGDVLASAVFKQAPQPGQ